MVTDDEIDARGCRGTDPAMWVQGTWARDFPARQRRELAAICAACPILHACREAACSGDVDRMPWAFVGGLTPRQRDDVRRRRPADKSDRERRMPCGTISGYKRHKRDGEPACAACLAASREESRRRRGNYADDTPIDHGTPRGYRQHRNRGIDACDECRKAWAAHQRATYRTKGKENAA